MKLLDPAHPFFAPLWRRVVIVVLTLGWAGVELASGNPFWAILFGAAGLYCAWHFFIAFPGPSTETPPKDTQDP